MRHSGMSILLFLVLSLYCCCAERLGDDTDRNETAAVPATDLVETALTLIVANKSFEKPARITYRPKIKRPTDECRVHNVTRVFSHPKCRRLPVVVSGCSGRCQSTSFTSYLRNGVYTDWSHPTFHTRCNCCQPIKKRYGHVVLDCPDDPVSKKRKVFVVGAVSCKCRRCASSN